MNPLQRISAWLDGTATSSQCSVPQSILTSPTVVRTYYLMGLNYASSSHGNATWIDTPAVSIRSFVEAFNDRSRWTDLWQPYVQIYANGSRHATYVVGPQGYKDVGTFTLAYVESKIKPGKRSRVAVTPVGVTFTNVLMELTVRGRVDSRPLSASRITISPSGKVFVTE